MTAKAAPWGSARIAIRPAPSASKAGFITFPPSQTLRFARLPPELQTSLRHHKLRSDEFSEHPRQGHRHRRRRPDWLRAPLPHRLGPDARRRHPGRVAPARDPRRGHGRRGHGDGARRLRLPADSPASRSPTIRSSPSTAPTSACWSERGRAARVWSARTCSRPTARSSSPRARRSTPERPTT